MCTQRGAGMLATMHIARQHPRFARLLAALASSQLGDWLYNLSLLAYVQERTHSTTWVGLTTVARIAPMVLGGPLGGLIADRFDRRAVMIAADVARAALMGGLVLVAVAGLPVILVPLAAALATLAGVAYPPSVAAVTPRLIPDDQLPAANAARAAIAPACVAAGPVLGAVLLLIGPPSVAFGLNALTFVVSGVLVASIRGGAAFARAPRAAGGDTAGVTTVLAELRAGARVLLAAPDAVRAVSADTAGSFVYGAQTVLLLVVAERLGLGAPGYGYLLAAQGAGGILGAAIAGRLGAHASRRGALAAALLLVGLPLPVLAVTTSVVVAVILGITAGVGALFVEVVAETRLQRSLDEERLGTAYGFAFSASIGGIAIGALVAPLLAALTSVSGALIVIGIGVTALAAVIARRSPQPLVVDGAPA